MFGSSDWNFVGKAWKAANKPEPKQPHVNRWVKVFSQKKPGEHLTLYEPKAFRRVVEWIEVNRVPHSITRFRGGGWRITRL